MFTPEECGTIIKSCWRENHISVAAILRNHCLDFSSFRQQMKINMFDNDFRLTGF